MAALCIVHFRQGRGTIGKDTVEVKSDLRLGEPARDVAAVVIDDSAVGLLPCPERIPHEGQG